MKWKAILHGRGEGEMRYLTHPVSACSCKVYCALLKIPRVCFFRVISGSDGVISPIEDNKTCGGYTTN